MKKSLVLFLSILILAVGGCIYIQAALFHTQEDVQITENILYGDKSAAEGVTITQNTKYSEYLHWDTTYRIGELPQATTNSSFSESQLEDYQLNQFGVTLMVDHERSRYPHWIDEKDYTGMTYAFLELAEETPNGETGQKTIYLKDYMDYYPINIMINLPEDINIDTASSIGTTENETESNMEENENSLVAQTFSEFIKIPVLEDAMRHIEVEKSENGTVSSSGSSWVEGHDSFRFTTFHTYTDKACYFTFDTRTERGNQIDTSHIPDGYGIYAFSYDSKKNTINVDSLRNIYPLESTKHILNLETDAENEHLLLFTKEDAKYILTVIDIETMQIKQELVFAENPKDAEDIEDYSPDFWIYDDFFVVQCQEHTLTVVTKEKETDTYKVEYTVKWDESSPLATTEELAWGDSIFDWDGKRLVMCSSLYNSETIFKECGFFVSVLDETGLVFLGRYDSSLNTGSYSDEEYSALAENYGIDTDGYFYMYECQPRSEKRLGVSW